MLIRIATTNDTSGNARRGWLRVNASGQVMGWIEEGYRGRGAIEEVFSKEGESPTIYVKPSEYKRFKNWGETLQNNFTEKELLNA
jgi:hypothetical protein